MGNAFDKAVHKSNHSKTCDANQQNTFVASQEFLMKKFFLIFLAIFAVGNFAFADTASENYLSHFEQLVNRIEADAKNKDASNISAYESLKANIDAERATVTLSIFQRFSDWRLTGRYESAHSKLVANSKNSDISAKAEDVKEKASGALESAKESASEKIDSAKTNVNSKAEELENLAREKLNQTVGAKSEEISGKVGAKAEELENAAKKKAEVVKDEAAEKIQSGTSKLTNILNGVLNNKESEDEK